MHSSFYNFFSHYPATTAISTLSLHDALPIYRRGGNHDEAVSAKDCAVGHARCASFWRCVVLKEQLHGETEQDRLLRSEEHTSELQSLTNLVCRLLLEKKKKINLVSATRRQHK